MLQPTVLSQTTLYSDPECLGPSAKASLSHAASTSEGRVYPTAIDPNNEDPTAMPLYQEFIKQMRGLAREKLQPKSTTTMSKESSSLPSYRQLKDQYPQPTDPSSARLPPHNTNAASHQPHNLDYQSKYATRIIYQTAQESKPTGQQPLDGGSMSSFQSNALGGEQQVHSVDRYHPQGEAATTSVDMLLRQRLTAGDASDNLNSKSQTDSKGNLYTLEELRQKQMRLGAHQHQQSQASATTIGGEDDLGEEDMATTGISVYKETAASAVKGGYPQSQHISVATRTQYNALKSTNESNFDGARGLLFDEATKASVPSSTFKAQSQPEIVTMMPDRKNTDDSDSGVQTAYYLQQQKSQTLTKNRLLIYEPTASDSIGFKQEAEGTNQRTQDALRDSQGPEGGFVESFGVRSSRVPLYPNAEHHLLKTSDRARADNTHSSGTHPSITNPSGAHTDNARSTLDSIEKNGDYYQNGQVPAPSATANYQRIKHLLQENSRIVGSLGRTAESTVTLGGALKESAGETAGNESTNDFGRKFTYQQPSHLLYETQGAGGVFGQFNSQNLGSRNGPEKIVAPGETLNRDINSQLSKNSSQGQKLSSATFEKVPSVRGVYERPDDNALNQRSEPTLIDSKQEDDIACNLAKLKADLRSQAEAIQDLRKTAWENTTSSMPREAVSAYDTGTLAGLQATDKTATPFSQTNHFAGKHEMVDDTLLLPPFSGRTDITSNFGAATTTGLGGTASNLAMDFLPPTSYALPAHEVTAQSLDLFTYQMALKDDMPPVQNKAEGVDKKEMTLDETEFEQLIDFQKRMDLFQKEKGHTTQGTATVEKKDTASVGPRSPMSNTSYQRKEEGDIVARRMRKPTKELRAHSTLSQTHDERTSHQNGPQRESLSHSFSETNIRDSTRGYIKAELTPNVIANSRREYRQFELAFNRQEAQGQFGRRKSSLQSSRPLSRHSKNERLIDVYSNGGLTNIAVTTNPTSQRKPKGKRKARSTETQQHRGNTARSRPDQSHNTTIKSRKSNKKRGVRNPFNCGTIASGVRQVGRSQSIGKKYKRTSRSVAILSRQRQQGNAVSDTFVSSKLLRAMQGPYAHRHRSQQRFHRASDISTFGRDPRLVFPTVGHQSQRQAGMKSARSRSRSKQIPATGRINRTFTVTERDHRHHTAVSERSKSRSCSTNGRLNSTQQIHRQTKQLAQATQYPGRPRSRSSRSHCRNKGVQEQQQYTRISEAFAPGSDFNYPSKLYTKPRSVSKSKSTSRSRSGSRSSQLRNRHQSRGLAAARPAQVFNPFARGVIDTNNKSLFSHRSSPHYNSKPSQTLSTSNTPGTGAINIVTRHNQYLMRSAERGDSAAKKPQSSKKGSKRKVGIPTGRAKQGVKGSVQQRGTMAYQQLPSQTTMSTSKARPTSTSNQNSARLKRQSSQKDCGLSTRRQSASKKVGAEDQKQVKALYSQLQEKSSELTDLLGRLKAIID